MVCIHLVVFFFFLMIRRPPRSTRTDTLFPYTTLFRSQICDGGQIHVVTWNPPLLPHCTTLDVDGEHVRLPRGVDQGCCELRRLEAPAGSVRQDEDAGSCPRDARGVPLSAQGSTAPVGLRHGLRSEEGRVGKEWVST